MVIDTDGSAFITKAEFDSLKNNFQAQIDNYNSSIDSKIDGAIASYLSGITVSSTRVIDWLNNKQREYKNQSLYSFNNGPYGWNFSMPIYIIISRQPSKQNGGLNGLGLIKRDPVPANGFLGTRLSASNNTDYLLNGYGSCSVLASGMLAKTGDRIENGTADDIAQKSTRWQLMWWKGSWGYDSHAPAKTADEYDGAFVKTNGVEYRPCFWSAPTNKISYIGYPGRMPQDQYTTVRSTNITSTVLPLIDDGEIKNLIDMEYENGVSVLMKQNTWMKQNNGSINVNLFALSAWGSNNDSTNGCLYKLIHTYDWTDGGYSGSDSGYASKTITDYNTVPQEDGKEPAAFNCNNWILAVDHVNNPTNIWTDAYNGAISSADFAAGGVACCKQFNGADCFNLRYGICLFKTSTKTATYTFDITNNDTNNLKFKIYHQPTSKSYSSETGIATNCSNSGNKNEMTCAPGATLTVTFTTNEAHPVIIKCDGTTSHFTLGDCAIETSN